MASADTPKYTDLMNWIREQILSGEFTIGMRLPSENELGKKFSISRQTVRQATSVLESEGLLERRRGSGTYVSATSNSVKKSSSRNIGVVLTYPSKTLPPQKIKALGIPCIFVHADTNPLMGIPSIRMDDYLLGQSAAEYLIKHGHKNIAGIFKSDDMQGQLRYSGVINALKHHDLLASERNMYWYTTEDIKLIRNGNLDTEILDRIGNATALVCYNDEMAKTLIDILYKAGKKIPDDISIISFDDLALESTIGLTTFAHPKQELGKIVAVQLLKLLDNPNFNASIKFPPKLIERDSVKTI